MLDDFMNYRSSTTNTSKCCAEVCGEVKDFVCVHKTRERRLVANVVTMYRINVYPICVHSVYDFARCGVCGKVCVVGKCSLYCA